MIGFQRVFFRKSIYDERIFFFHDFMSFMGIGVSEYLGLMEINFIDCICIVLNYDYKGS